MNHLNNTSQKINIGILFPFSKSYGGIFQYTLSIADSLLNYSDKFNYILIHNYPKNIEYLVSSKLKSTDILKLQTTKSNVYRKAAIFINLLLGRKILNMKNAAEVSCIRNNNIKLLIIPFPSSFGFRNNIPYITTIPDMMHKYFPKFPEYPLLERIKRDMSYKNAAKNSVITIVDSKQGEDDLNNFYKIPREKIRKISYIPPGYIYKYRKMNLEEAREILKKYNLPEKFIFYPAQFWYHKNHTRLIEALKLIADKYQIKIPLVLVGSPKESYKNIVKHIKNTNLGKQITNLGYVADNEIVALYKKSVALVFPDLLGPTNIPPLEAIVLGTPVICSNVFSMPEQIGEAGLFFNPYDINDMAQKIYKVWTDNDLRIKLIAKANEKAKSLVLEKYAEKWEKVIDEALSKI